MAVMRQPVSPTVMKATEPPPLLYTAQSLLVGILYISLVLLVQVGHDGLVCLVHRLALILQPFAFGIDGGMDGELERMPVDEAPVAHTGQHVERAVDGKRHYGQLELVGEHEGTAAEYPHVSGKRAGSLGENHQRHAFAQRVARMVIGLAYLARPTLVYKDVMGIVARGAHQRHIAQAALHHPLEVAVQETVDEEDVKRSLMIAYEYIRLVLAQMLAPLDLDG